MPYKVTEILGAVINMPTFDNLSGISGGPLLHKKDNSVIGLICASGVEGVEINGQEVPFLGIVPANSIIEVLDVKSR
jgi:hypothetical protein